MINEMMDMKGRVALVTGSTGKIGRAFAETLAELRCDLILLDLDNEKLFHQAEYLSEKFDVNVSIFACDLECRSQRTECLDQLLSEHKKLNVLINNAAFTGGSGITGWNVPANQQSSESFGRSFEVNVTAVFDLCQTLRPLMQKTGDASIINIASIYGLHGPDWSIYRGTDINNISGYGASKGALVQLTRWLAATYAPEIRANVIAPGGVFRDQDPKFVEAYEARTPLGRMAEEKDLQGALAFLASDLSMYVNGLILNVDGGWGV
jgi:NAD(P)-dependent dehydrogenase (short-subunit alcohol dehydrogenase family)